MQSPIVGNKIQKHSVRDHGYSLAGPSFLPIGEEELALRELLQFRLREYRELRSNEIDALTQNGNHCDDWGEVQVTDRFNPRQVVGCTFFGRVRIGTLENFILEFEHQKYPVGLYRSRIVGCDLGDNVALHDVGYLGHTIVGDMVIMANVGRLLTTPNARFGHGVLKEREGEGARAWIAVGNENGGRGVLAFDGMRPADATLWARHRGDTELMRRLRELTDATFDRRPGYYGPIGERTVILDTRAIVDVAIGTDALIRGADRLENLTLRSSREEPIFVGEGVSLGHGIVGFGSRAESGAFAERFVLGANVRLSKGARIVDCVIGDNGNIACCEMIGCLVMPHHEQHHNNSFLIAATLLGQSNIAAGATLGSNHNSRAADGELLAGRGFWPGLCVSLKHNCRFASFTLVAKGDYPAELDVPLPFALVSQSPAGDVLRVMPAYWFLHNMYALKRAEWKFAARDKRVRKDQPIVHAALAPDTVEEIFTALELLELWVGRAQARAGGAAEAEALDPDELRAQGRRLLMEDPERAGELEVLGANIENARRPTLILKAAPAWRAYRAMANHYAVNALVDTMEQHQIARVENLVVELDHGERDWHNLGGQLVSCVDLRILRDRIVDGQLATWQAVHEAMDGLWEGWPDDQACHAVTTLQILHGDESGKLTEDLWRRAMQGAVETQQTIRDQVRVTRARDFSDPFRAITFDDEAEMTAVLGRLDDDPFIQHIDEQTERFLDRIAILEEQTGVSSS